MEIIYKQAIFMIVAGDDNDVRYPDGTEPEVVNNEKLYLQLLKQFIAEFLANPSHAC